MKGKEGQYKHKVETRPYALFLIVILSFEQHFECLYVYFYQQGKDGIDVFINGKLKTTTL